LLIIVILGFVLFFGLSLVCPWFVFWFVIDLSLACRRGFSFGRGPGLGILFRARPRSGRGRGLSLRVVSHFGGLARGAAAQRVQSARGASLSII
jgi:hypothetical protein